MDAVVVGQEDAHCCEVADAAQGLKGRSAAGQDDATGVSQYIESDCVARCRVIAGKVAEMVDKILA